MKWKMPYNAGFNKWFVTSFADNLDKTETLFQHQQLVKNFMQEGSPYHGLLLYHGLGVGKTRSAIEIAKSNKKDVVVMLPASLRENFLGEIQKVADSRNSSFDFLSYNGINRKNIKQYVEDNFFDNKLIIIDEVHNFISRATGAGMICKQLYQALMNAKNVKIVALSGTPLINKPIEIGSLINLLNGYIYSTVFKYIGYTEFDSLEQTILRIPCVASCFIDTEINTVTVSYLPEGFIKNDSEEIYKSEKHTKSLQDIKSILEKNGLNIKSEKVVKSLIFPLKEEEFEEYFVDYESSDIKNELLFLRRAGGLVSYFESYNPEEYPEQLPLKIIEVPMSKNHFGKYLKVRQEEIDKETRALKFKKNKSTNTEKKEEIKNGNVYRSFSRAVCNFAFPPDIKRPYPSTLKYETDDPYLIEEETEKALDWKDKIKIYEKKLDESMKALENNSAKYLNKSGLEDCGPKMLAIIENIKKSEGPVLVYSAFRNVEGLAIFGFALHENLGYEELSIKKIKGQWKMVCKNFNAPKYIIFSENREETTILLDIYNSDFDKLPDSIGKQLQETGYKTNLHGEYVKILMITQSGAEGISLKNVRQVHEMEPHWNNIRSKQVRGRAIRARSHISLPKNERKVETFLYMVILNDEQKSHSLFKAHDDGLTSDGYVYDIARRKEIINNKFLELIQRNAIDCLVNKKAHKGRVSCFKPPHTKNNFVYYVGDISHDVLDKHIIKKIKTKKEYKQLNLKHNGKELVYLMNPTKNDKEKYMDILKCDSKNVEGWLGVFYINDVTSKNIVGLMKFKENGGIGFKWIIKPDKLEKI